MLQEPDSRRVAEGTARDSCRATVGWPRHSGRVLTTDGFGGDKARVLCSAHETQGSAGLGAAPADWHTATDCGARLTTPPSAPRPRSVVQLQAKNSKWFQISFFLCVVWELFWLAPTVMMILGRKHSVLHKSLVSYYKSLIQYSFCSDDFIFCC